MPPHLREQAGGLSDTWMRGIDMEKTTCDECGKPRGTKGNATLCARCYATSRRAYWRSVGGKPCLVEGCVNRIISGARMCDMHAHRLRRHGDVGSPLTTQKPRGTTFYKIPAIRERVLAEQGGLCGLCRGEAKDWHVDHDHRCCPQGDFCEKCIRAVLCRACNVGLGMFKDDPAMLRRAADYIESFRR